ncbi:MAG TPA: porin, partial [Thermoanaerobaculia bacterium]|nr:porin [Thermoanaerobaculia bacterium]
RSPRRPFVGGKSVSRILRSLAASCLIAVCVSPLRAQDKPAPSPTDDEIQQKVKAEVEKQLKEREAKTWTAGVNPQGGGVFVKSPDGKTLFRLYGYAQPTFTYTDRDNGATFEETDFRVRRARLDFAADYDDRYKLFVEVDGAPSDGTALVEAYVQAAYVKDRQYFRFGKFITPFSTENLRSSRALDTVERFQALNAMFSLPALDVQFGPMLWGYLDAGKKVTYYLGVFNGNASAGAAVVSGQRGNARDNNGHKEVQGRLNVKWTDSFTTGVAVDDDKEESQTLTLASYSGSRFVGIPVVGKRRGWDGDVHWKHRTFSFDSEYLSSDFKDSNAKLSGGYVQTACWARGDEAHGGVQAVLRAEEAEITPPIRDGGRLEAVTLGANVWFNGWTRWQINAIDEHFDGRGNGTFKTGAGWRPTVLSQFQIKF